MSVLVDQDMELKRIERDFLALTGLNKIATHLEHAGPETFLRFQVGRDAPLYRSALAALDQSLPSGHEFHGRLSLDVQRQSDVLNSPEIDLLRSLISRSLRVTNEAVERSPTVVFEPFRGGEENRVTQPVNHAILGRRGVGKSSLILMAHSRLLSSQQIPVWIDLQTFHKRTDAYSIIEILNEILDNLIGFTQKNIGDLQVSELISIRQSLAKSSSKMTLEEIRRLVPGVRTAVKAFRNRVGRSVFVFLDDAHMLGTEIQPALFDVVHSVLKGGGGWLKVAGVKNLLRLYDNTERVGLQHPNDVQLISLDLTLEDPAAAREHLTGVLQRFLVPCGFRRRTEIARDRAIDRLVWCAAGVPRDFLSLLERSIGLAAQHHRKRVGVEEVNGAVGEYGQEKMSELEKDTTGENQRLSKIVERLQSIVLDKHRSNCFLVRPDTSHDGYLSLRKLVDLRLVHLIHPSITPDEAGNRYEAYLLDYSFYTGVRRRQRLTELKIDSSDRPRYATLRRLPKVDLDALIEGHGEPVT